MTNATILMPTHKRTHLLELGLHSLTQQHLGGFDLEIIVLNDGLPDGSEEICESYRDRLNVKYVFTGQRNLVEETWRCPLFPYNIGAKLASWDIIILSCAEMFHVSPWNIVNMIDDINRHDNIRCTLRGRDDLTSEFLSNVSRTDLEHNINLYCRAGYLNTALPFFMGFKKEYFFRVGGFDEDLTGIGSDDNDLMDRLELLGLRLHEANGNVIHLYHPRSHSHYGDNFGTRFLYNEGLYMQRKGTVKRNVGREWGVNPDA